MSLADSHGLLAASGSIAGASAFAALFLDGSPLFDAALAVMLGASLVALLALWNFLGAWEALAKEAEHGRSH